jgi:cleavage and polyadenylation specificity factor subunit 1
MNAIRQEILPASGVSFATTLKLTPSTLNQSFKTKGKVLYNVVTARSNVLRVYEVRQLVVKDRQAVSMSVDDMDMEGSSDIRKVLYTSEHIYASH